jgi:hypothetical protein
VSDPTVEKPGVLDNFRLRCKHGSVLIPPYLVDISIDSTPTELKKNLGYEESSRCGFPDSEIITYPQWRALLKIYGSNPPTGNSINTAVDVSEFENTNLPNNSCEMEIIDSTNIHMVDMSTDINTGAPVCQSENGKDESNAIDSEVFEVTIRAPVRSAVPQGLECEGRGYPRARMWCWAPSLCAVCRQESEDRVNDLHLNFHHHSFEVIIVPHDPLEDECDLEKYAEYSDNRPCDLTAGSSHIASAPAPALTRRNPTRRGAGRRGTKAVRIELSSDDLISFVKAKLAERVEDSVLTGLGGHVLVCSGQRLTDHTKTLREYGVKRDEPLSLLLSNSTEGLSGLFFQSKADSLYENGFGKNSFLSSGSGVTGLGSAPPVISVVHDIEPAEEDIVKVREVTGCTVGDAVRELVKSRGDVNAACEALFSI